MNCRLCDLIKKLENTNNKTNWTKELNVTIEDDINNTQTLKLTGLKIGDEIVRYENNNYLGVNIFENKKYSDDVIILMPKKHFTNEEIDWNTFMKAVYKIIDTQYQGNAQIMINQGSRFASVPEHAHAHIIQSAKTGFYVPPLRKKY